jgi:Lrp/AsnC family leucine-responsive transcriptional regulator
MSNSLDTIDFKIIQHLMSRGRVTWSELAATLELSAPATADRVRRLEERGVVQGYSALVDPEAVGCGLTAFISVTLERPEHRDPFLKRILELPQIQECHHVAGDDDYLLKVRCRSPRDLEQIITERIKSLQGIVRTRTTIVLSTAKETPALPLPR